MRSPSWFWLGLFAALHCGTQASSASAEADSEDAALGSLRLRGGIDANPLLVPGGAASAFAGMDAAFAVGRQVKDFRIGIVGEAERNEFLSRGVQPSERYRLALEMHDEVDGWALRSSTSVGNERTASLHALDASQRLRAQWVGGPVRPFLSAEIGFHTLNETNAILTGFLPEPQRFARATIIPGVTARWGRAEVGVSLSASATRYMEAVDLFGYRRQNERLQPFLFARYDGEGISASASVSRLYGFWHDADFSRVNETLFDVNVARTMGRVSLELAASRFAADTSFPVSPLSITESYSVKASYSPNDDWTWSGTGRSLRTRYLDSPFVADTTAYGIGVSRALPAGWSIGAEVLRLQGTALNGRRFEGGLAMLSLSKRIAVGGSEKRWAPDAPPTVPRSSPQSLKSMSLSSALPAPRPYQPP